MPRNINYKEKMGKLSILAKNRVTLASVAICLSRVGSAQPSNFVQQIAESSLDLNPLWLMQTESSGENASTIFKQTSSTEESNWMSMIDLIQRTELQLDPVRDLQKDFDSATETFFSKLEDTQDQGSDKEKESAEKLRTAISKYEETCEEIMESFSTLMNDRKTNESLAVKSLQVTTQANTIEAEKKDKAKQERAANKSDSDDKAQAAQETAQTGNAQETTETKDEADKTDKDEASDGKETESDPSKDSEESVDSDNEESTDGKAAVDTGSPLGQLIVELRMLEELGDSDLVSVCYGGGEEESSLTIL